MTDEQIEGLRNIVVERIAILNASAAWGSSVDGHLLGRLLDVIDAQAAEIERLREALVDVTHFADRNGVDIARAALAQETQP